MSEASHMEYAGAWELAEGPNPERMRDFFAWLIEDDARMASAIDHMQWIPVGINVLTLAKKKPDGVVAESLQLNFYHPEVRGNDNAHAHARNARTTWYAHDDSRQLITRERALPTGATRLPDVPVHERIAVANCLVDYGDAGRPGYRPVILGERLVLRQSVTSVAPLGWQYFDSTEVHSIAFEGAHVAVSLHHKGRSEPRALNSAEGLTMYKGLSNDESAEVLDTRATLVQSLLPGQRLSATTMLYPTPDFNPEDMQPEPIQTDPQIALEVIFGAYNTIKRLAA